MSIIQISKIQQRSGDLVDLPQLSEAEFGFATDERRLFIGKTEGNTENIEVLTAYSQIAFDQIDGVTGNINIDASTLANGQVLVYNGTDWVNGGYINLGNVSNVSIEGGAIGYVLTTDGSGGLSWTPKGFVVRDIQTISASSSARLTLVEPYPYSLGAQVTINDIGSSSYDVLNGGNVWLKPVPGNLQLYDLFTNSALTTPLNTNGYGSYPANTGLTIFNTVTSTGGVVGGSNTSVQYNSGTDFAGDSSFTWDYVNSTLNVVGTINVSGNANVGNIGSTGVVASNATVTGTLTTVAVTTGGNSTAGTLTGNWTLTSGSRLTATYADLAEYYCADKSYEPGTVVEFGGDKEVTLSKEESNKVAGIVSTNPAYVMNATLECEENSLMIALIGRVPVKVIGKVNKGDMLISAGNGFAKAAITMPKVGTVIGKAIANKSDDGEGVVEVLVGRL
jgi:hypothetical protein